MKLNSFTLSFRQTTRIHWARPLYRPFIISPRYTYVATWTNPPMKSWQDGSVEQRKKITSLAYSETSQVSVMVESPCLQIEDVSNEQSQYLSQTWKAKPRSTFSYFVRNIFANARSERNSRNMCDGNNALSSSEISFISQNCLILLCSCDMNNFFRLLLVLYFRKQLLCAQSIHFPVY